MLCRRVEGGLKARYEPFGCWARLVRMNGVERVGLVAD